MDSIKFSIVLKEQVVFLTDKDKVEKKYLLKELTGAQRADYNSNFDVKIKMVDGKAQMEAGEKFIMPSAIDFLALCFYDFEGKLMGKEFVQELPNSVITVLHENAVTLSGLDKEALDAAKNASEVKDTSGSA